MHLQLPSHWKQHNWRHKVDNCSSVGWSMFGNDQTSRETLKRCKYAAIGNSTLWYSKNMSVQHSTACTENVQCRRLHKTGTKMQRVTPRLSGPPFCLFVSIIFLPWLSISPPLCLSFSPHSSSSSLPSCPQCSLPHWVFTGIWAWINN